MSKIDRKIELTRVNVNLPTPLVNRVKSYSLELGIPATQGYVLLLTKALDNEDVIRHLPKLLELYEESKNTLLD